MRTIGYIAAFAILAMAGLAGAGEDREGRRSPRPPPDGGGPGVHFGLDVRKWEKIELSSSQRERLLEALTRNFRASQEVVLDQLEARRRQGDGGRERPRHDENDPFREKLMSLQRDLRSDIEAILTPDQLKQLDGGRRDGPPPRGDGEGRRPPKKRPN